MLRNGDRYGVCGLDSEGAAEASESWRARRRVASLSVMCRKLPCLQKAGMEICEVMSRQCFQSVVATAS